LISYTYFSKIADELSQANVHIQQVPTKVDISVGIETLENKNNADPN
jgi:hypothetical protein